MERQFCLHGADLLAIAERRDCYGAIYIAKLRCFQQRQRRNALASGKLKSVGDQCVIFVAANLDFVGIVLTIVRELRFYRLFPDNSIQMSRSNNSKLIVCDDGIELLLRFTQSRNVVKK